MESVFLVNTRVIASFDDAARMAVMVVFFTTMFCDNVVKWAAGS
jgi:hypothetical protein